MTEFKLSCGLEFEFEENIYICSDNFRCPSCIGKTIGYKQGKKYYIAEITKNIKIDAKCNPVDAYIYGIEQGKKDGIKEERRRLSNRFHILFSKVSFSTSTTIMAREFEKELMKDSKGSEQQ